MQRQGVNLGTRGQALTELLGHAELSWKAHMPCAQCLHHVGPVSSEIYISELASFHLSPIYIWLICLTNGREHNSADSL